MIIVSQDKKAIYNFDNISSIQIEGCNGTYNLIVYDQINDRDSLGTYETEERAIQVLGEIIEFYEDTKQKMMLQNVHMLYAEKNDFVYYMPLQ